MRQTKEAAYTEEAKKSNFDEALIGLSWEQLNSLLSLRDRSSKKAVWLKLNQPQPKVA